MNLSNSPFIFNMILAREAHETVINEELTIISSGKPRNLDVSIPKITTGDEVEQLAQSFDYMKQSLKQYIADLTETTATKDMTQELVLNYFNQDLSTDNPSLLFVTLFLGILNIKDGIISTWGKSTFDPWRIQFISIYCCK